MIWLNDEPKDFKVCPTYATRGRRVIGHLATTIYHMTTVLCGTHRPNSKTSQVAQYIYNSLRGSGLECQYLTLEDIDWSAVTTDMFDASKHPDAFRRIDEQYMIGADKWIIVSPEYNGSFPGVLKLFIDAISTHRYAETFADKKALLVGVASGRAGNLRGMEHLTGLLNYLKVHVYPQKLPISSVSTALADDGTPNADTSAAITNLLEAFHKV